MKKLFVGLVVAALFSPLSFAEEGKKKDSFAGAGVPTNFAMGYAKATDPCPNNGDIAMDEKGLILSCQSGSWKNTKDGLTAQNCSWHRWGTSNHFSSSRHSATCPIGTYNAGMGLSAFWDAATYGHDMLCCYP